MPFGTNNWGGKNEKNTLVCCNQERLYVIGGEKFWKAVQCKTIETSIILTIMDI